MSLCVFVVLFRDLSLLACVVMCLLCFCVVLRACVLVDAFGCLLSVRLFGVVVLFCDLALVVCRTVFVVCLCCSVCSCVGCFIRVFALCVFVRCWLFCVLALLACVAMCLLVCCVVLCAPALDVALGCLIYVSVFGVAVLLFVLDLCVSACVCCVYVLFGVLVLSGVVLCVSVVSMSVCAWCAFVLFCVLVFLVVTFGCLRSVRLFCVDVLFCVLALLVS